MLAMSWTVLVPDFLRLRPVPCCRWVARKEDASESGPEESGPEPGREKLARPCRWVAPEKDASESRPEPGREKLRRI